MDDALNPSVDRFVSGDVEVLCLTDGGKVLPPEIFPTLDAETRGARLQAWGLGDIDIAFNTYLLRHPGGIDLVDTGCGSLVGADAGHTVRIMAELGIAPDDVDRIIFTHLHGDHVGGAFGEGGLIFPQAEILMHGAEADHWRGKDAPGGRLVAEAKRLVPLDDGADLGHGIRLWHLPGHTPGHSGLRIGGLVIVADIVHSEALQLPDPDLAPSYDVDPVQAAATRREALSRVAAEGSVWSGCHMLGPRKFARLTRDRGGFARVPL
ncbi:MBL fold metallo-hydrolase [Sagittula stellata]|uniref:Metallo-beta-lactamase family protein n=1 Tax=Sagittula stellata (strain ATCC 700073 / DSM 11524 / E-37) TaxID=388399 RepID=A3K224_SAGS3|nr:MBL fold metallo-hydrolase [Sagittula stellata]EBA08970.1 metallo-beta-lactamase family protein [Sagittula stellata E-37]